MDDQAIAEEVQADEMNQIDDLVIAEAVQDVENQEESEESEDGVVDELIEDAEAEEQLLNALISNDPTLFEAILNATNTETAIVNLQELMENHKEKVNELLKSVKTKLTEERDRTKEERDRQKKLRKAAEEAIKTTEEHGKSFTGIVRFEGQDYAVTVYATDTFKTFRFRLMTAHPVVFTTISMVSGLLYTMNDINMKQFARRTFHTKDANKGWQVRDGFIIIATRTKPSAKAKSKAAGPKSKAKAKSSASSSGSGVQ